MNLITLDFETFYDTSFSLSRLTTEEYIRSPDFELIGVGVKVNKEIQPYTKTPYLISEPLFLVATCRRKVCPALHSPMMMVT